MDFALEIFRIQGSAHYITHACLDAGGPVNLLVLYDTNHHWKFISLLEPPHSPHRFNTSYAGHMNIHDDQIVVLLSGLLEHLFTGMGDFKLIAHYLKRFLSNRTRQFIVMRNEHFKFGVTEVPFKMPTFAFSADLRMVLHYFGNRIEQSALSDRLREVRIV
jgi:hypothetical protein